MDLSTQPSNTCAPPEIQGEHTIPIDVVGLTFGYTSIAVFDNFSWSSDKPITILEGPSGCGKTTLLRILAGHLTPTGCPTWQAPANTRLILQDDGLFPWLSAEGNLFFVPEWPGFESMPAEIEELADLVKPFANQIVGTLSFGQRRIIELLRILGCASTLTLLDEPLNFLDLSRRKIVIKTIRALAEQEHDFVISSHYENDFSLMPCRRFRFDGDMPYRTLQLVE